MLKIQKQTEPRFFADFKDKNAPKSWNDLNPITTRLRQYIMDEEQTIGDTALCTYCEQKICLEKSHIDHIKPKDQSKEHAKLFATYENLTVSCNRPTTCGHAKGNKYHEDFINPIEENSCDFMTYEFTTGKIIPANEAVKTKVEVTCNLLGLNSCKELKKARQVILLSLNSMHKDGKVHYYINEFKEFPTLIKLYKEVFLTD